MVNKQKRWVGMVIVEFNSEDFLQAKDKIEDMNQEVYDTFHGDSNVVYLTELPE